MKVGLSTWSLFGAINKGELNAVTLLDWIKENGGDYVEYVPAGFTLTGNDKLIAEVKNRADEIDLPIEHYSTGADTLKDYDEAVKFLQKEIDTAASLGCKTFRHDLVMVFDPAYCTVQNFEKDFPTIIKAAKELNEYAKQYNIVTSVENHGYFMNKADNCIRLVEAVESDTFGITLDVGNFASVDEDCVVATKKCLPYAKMVHFKDWYFRNPRHMGKFEEFLTKECFSRTLGGVLCRGAMIGNGDLDLISISESVKDFDYKGCVTVEFEGHEESKFGSRIGLAATKALLF